MAVDGQPHLGADPARRAPGLHLLGEQQHDLAQLFGAETGDEVDKLVHTTWEAGPGGVPLLVTCPNRFVGRILERYDVGGDHVCVILEPVDVSVVGSEAPLRLGQVADIEPGHPA